MPCVARKNATKSCNTESQRQVIPIFRWRVTWVSNPDLFRTTRTRIAATIIKSEVTTRMKMMIPLMYRWILS